MKHERIFIESVVNKQKYLEINFRRNGKTLQAISKNFHYFRDSQQRYVWVQVEDTSAGVLILHEGRPFPGGDLSIGQRLRVMDQAVNLTLTLLSKESIGPKRVTGLLNRFYQNICNAITGDVSFFQDAGQNERSHDGELSPAGESIREVENGLSTFEKDTPIQSPSGIGD